MRHSRSEQSIVLLWVETLLVILGGRRGTNITRDQATLTHNVGQFRRVDFRLKSSH